jgi:hypothetical protein
MDQKQCLPRARMIFQNTKIAPNHLILRPGPNGIGSLDITCDIDHHTIRCKAVDECIEVLSIDRVDIALDSGMIVVTAVPLCDEPPVTGVVAVPDVVGELPV